MELETINRLYLELSQFATAKTAREIALEKQVAELQATVPEGMAMVPDDYNTAMDMLSMMFEAYEYGTPCYDGGSDEDGSYIGPAFRIDDEDFQIIADLLNKHRPVAAAKVKP